MREENHPPTEANFREEGDLVQDGINITLPTVEGSRLHIVIRTRTDEGKIVDYHVAIPVNYNDKKYYHYCRMFA